MVIFKRNVGYIALVEAERDAPISIDMHRMLSSTVPFQRMKVFHAFKVLWAGGHVERVKDQEAISVVSLVDMTSGTFMKELFKPPLSELPDHAGAPHFVAVPASRSSFPCAFSQILT